MLILLNHRRFIRVGEWLLLFLFILAAIWAVTQNAQAPQLILLALLYVITINFSLPPQQSSVGLVPLVAVSSLLALGLETAVSLAIISFILAELAAPLWQSIWQLASIQRPSRRQHLVMAVLHIAPLWLAGLIYQQMGGVAPLTNTTQTNLDNFIWLALSFGLLHFTLTLAWWLAQKRLLATFLRDNALSVLMSGLLAQSLAILGAVTLAELGLPIFVIFCLGVMGFSVLIWLSWQRRSVLEQQHAQFARLNHIGNSLRETLHLPDVLENTYQLVNELIHTDSFTIVLREGERWERPFHTLLAQSSQISFQPDDFTQWVANRGRTLYVEGRDLHFAEQHQLQPPLPMPAVWLGIPLNAAGQFIGVMILQRFTPEQSFGRWQRELLLAIAGQASAAIQNARLYSETVRLYNLTDEALAQRLKQLQALLNSIQEGVLMLDTNGHIALINPFAAALLGQTTAELEHSRLTSDIAPTIGYQRHELEELLSHLANGRLPDSQKSTFPLEQRVLFRLEAPVLTANQRALGWLMLFRDVTDEHQLAEQKADLTRMIVHDLRNPISTLISTIGLAQAHANGTAVSYLDDAQQGCLDMLDMVDSLMDMTRLETGQMILEAEAVYLHPLLERIMLRLQPLATKRGLTLTFTAESDLPAVWADEEMIRRVLINLLDNALKFTPANGRIHAHLQPEPQLTVEHEPGLRCLIQDSGPGIPAEHRQQVFNRFMRTNIGGAQVRGTGLGLAFCHMAIEAHDGHIWVESADEGGSLFIFTLPGVPILTEEIG